MSGNEPLTPPECDLRGLAFMPLDVIRLLDSDLFALSTGDEFKAALALWCKSWTQIPGGSLPADDRVLAHLSGAGSKWPKLKAMALRGWQLAEDGRLYHDTVAEKANEAWERRGEWQERQNTKAERQRRWRERVKHIAEKLRQAGITPPPGASLETLERLASERGVHVSEETHVDAEASTQPSTVDATETLKTGTADRGQRTGDRDIKKERGGPRKRGSRLPDDWVLSAELIAYGVALGFSDAKVRSIAERFKLHWQSSSSRNAVKLDWDKAFQGWLRDDAEKLPRKAAAGRPSVW